MAMRVVDLSVDELKILIQETVTQTITNLLHDPDDGLILREDFQSELQDILEQPDAGGTAIPAEDLATRLGLDW